MNNRAIKYKCPGAKRLMLEARELREKTEDYWAQPIDDNLVSIYNDPNDELTTKPPLKLTTKFSNFFIL